MTNEQVDHIEACTKRFVQRLIVESCTILAAHYKRVYEPQDAPIRYVPDVPKKEQPKTE